jgi:3-oxoacyl-[acyl-carrier-protein] synthase III
MGSYIKCISYYLPEKVLTNDELRSSFPDSNIDELYRSAGVFKRHIIGKNEIPSDMAVKAAEKLFEEYDIDRNEIDFILFCTISNDYIAPTTACVLQDRLHIPKTAGAIDFNHGCSGFVYGLALADGLIQSGSAKKILLLNSEAISRYIHKKDKGNIFLFGDAASAALIVGEPSSGALKIGKFILGSDGSGSSRINIKYGGARHALSEASDEEISDEYGNIRTEKNFYMDGNAVFLFSINIAPKIVNQILEKSDVAINDVDFFIFHQANKLILETIGKKLKLPAEKIIIDIKDVGNTVSSSIPIALVDSKRNGTLKRNSRILLAAFGVGYSWAATIAEVQ